MTLKEFRKCFDYSSVPISLIVLALDGTNIKIQYDNYDLFKEQEDFNSYHIVSFMASKYFFDIFVKQ